MSPSMAQPIIAGVAALVAIASLEFAWWASREQRRRTHFELARTLHSDLTTGDVARARSILGTLVHGSSDPRRAVDGAAARDAYFTLLWCWERVYAGRKVLVGSHVGDPKRDGTPVRFLDDLITWHVGEWRGNRGTDPAEPPIGIDLVKGRVRDLIGQDPDDHESYAAFGKLVDDLVAIGQLPR